MLGKSPDQNQKSLFDYLLSQMIDEQHELVLLAHAIDWKGLEKEFSSLYSHTGKPSMPLRFMIGCLLLKSLKNLGDETLAKCWVENPYMQYFCGEAYFQHQFPCDPSDFVHFRKRIGKAGLEYIFTYSVKLHGNSHKCKQVLSDTTVQENNTTFPTDAKLSKKIIDDCRKIAKEEGISQRQSYVRVSKQYLRQTHNPTHPKRAKKAKAASSKLKTLAGRTIRALNRKWSDEAKRTHKERLDIFEKVWAQKKTDKQKVYSIHKPFTACIAKGKAHKKYEFGNKIGLIVNPKDLVILGVESYAHNPHDSKTIAPLLAQMKSHLGHLPEEVVYDRGGRGHKEIMGVKISTPGKPPKSQTPYQRTKVREKFRRRAAIEPIIGHLKSDHRMAQNYHRGVSSPKMNALLASTAWNMKKLMEKLKKGFFCLLQMECFFIFFLQIRKKLSLPHSYKLALKG